MWNALIDLIRSCAERNRADIECAEMKKSFPEGRYAFITAYSALFAAVFSFIAAVAFFCQLGAMEKANDDNAKSFYEGNRAYVFPKDLNAATELNPSTFIMGKAALNPIFVNTGKTPAFHVTCWDDQKLTDAEVGLNRRPATTFTDLGPEQSIQCTPITFAIKDLVAVWSKTGRLFVWIRVEYNDAFANTPRHHTELCSEVLVLRDPSAFVDTRLGAPDMLAFQPSSPRCNHAN